LKEKALFSILLISMIVSATFMLFILSGIDSVRTRSANVGPGGFNSIIQLNHGLDDYANALEKYRFNTGNTDEQLHWKQKFQSEFEILWGNLDYFTLRSLEIGSTENLFVTFKHDAQQFLNKTENLMANDITLDTKQATAVLDDVNVLRDQIHAVAREHFNSYLMYRDAQSNNLRNLNKQLLFFSAVLVSTAGLLVAFLVRSNRKKNMLIREADDARSALSSTVEELRSGRLEQRAKDSFIAAASHDLRQPLHALGLFLGSLETHITDDKGHSTLNEAIECSTNLGSLFNSLLDLSRLDAGIVKVEHEHFRLQSLVAMLQHEYHAKTSHSPVNIKMQAQDEVVKSDPILLSRIIRNLIENALIHSGADTITVNCTKKNNVVELEVQDNGVGISQAEQQRVFSEYYQINNRSSNTGKGLGLGLSIVKRLADLLEMRISLHSEVGVSTKFTMDIALGDERQILSSEPEYENDAITNISQIANATIAVVDDDEKICVAMATMLHSIGLCVVTATSTDALIDKIIESNISPSMIVADYRLQKGQTGDQAIIQLRRALNLNVPGLLITGDTSPSHVADAAQSGFELLHKPVQPSVLSDTIRKVLARQLEESTLAEKQPAITATS